MSDNKNTENKLTKSEIIKYVLLCAMLAISVGLLLVFVQRVMYPGADLISYLVLFRQFFVPFGFAATFSGLVGLFKSSFFRKWVMKNFTGETPAARRRYKASIVLTVALSILSIVASSIVGNSPPTHTVLLPLFVTKSQYDVAKKKIARVIDKRHIQLHGTDAVALAPDAIDFLIEDASNAVFGDSVVNKYSAVFNLAAGSAEQGTSMVGKWLRGKLHEVVGIDSAERDYLEAYRQSTSSSSPLAIEVEYVSSNSLGRMAFSRNRLEEADSWFGKAELASKSRPGGVVPTSLHRNIITVKLLTRDLVGAKDAVSRMRNQYEGMAKDKRHFTDLDKIRHHNQVVEVELAVLFETYVSEIARGVDSEAAKLEMVRLVDEAERPRPVSLVNEMARAVAVTTGIGAADELISSEIAILSRKNDTYDLQFLWWRRMVLYDFFAMEDGVESAFPGHIIPPPGDWLGFVADPVGSVVEMARRVDMDIEEARRLAENMKKLGRFDN